MIDSLLERHPEFRYPRRVLLRRFLYVLGWILLRVLARLRIEGRENLPDSGPLIVVGNPGTSKTLAMTIICEKLNPYTKAPIFDVLGLPSILPFSYQCSRHSTADEILRRFVDAKKAQDKANAGVGTGDNILNTVVFLDEVGLAEESPHMPLKVLHKLLDLTLTLTLTL